jgi:hypothetical protein
VVHAGAELIELVAATLAVLTETKNELAGWVHESGIGDIIVAALEEIGRPSRSPYQALLRERSRTVKEMWWTPVISGTGTPSLRQQTQHHLGPDCNIAYEHLGAAQMRCR